MILRLLLITMSIPLSAMAGEFSRLTPVQEAFILAGHHCCYSDEVLEQVLINNREFQEKGYNLNIPIHVPQNYWQEPSDRWMWVLFWGIQLADIYSTHEGVKWDCIREANPLLPNIPTIAEMATLKGVILLPTYGAIGYENITRGQLVAPLLLGSFVVHNNLRLTDKAENAIRNGNIPFFTFFNILFSF